jgi:hypothetical protein
MSQEERWRHYNDPNADLHDLHVGAKTCTVSEPVQCRGFRRRSIDQARDLFR